MTKILLIGSHILGNSTATERIYSVLKQVQDAELSVESISQQELDTCSLPKAFKRYQAISTQYVLRKKLAKYREQSFDWVICITVQPLLALGKLFPQAKIACWYDTLPHHPGENLSAKLMNKASHLLYASAFNRVNVLLPMSHWAQNQQHSFRFREIEKSWVMPIGVDRHTWQKQQRQPDEPLKSSPLKVLMVGNDVKRKGFLDFFLWCIQTNQDLSPFEFTLLTQEHNETLHHLTQHIPLKIHHHTSHANLQDLVSFYHRSDIFFLPTKADMMPNVLIEAAAAKLPIIASKVGAISEVVRDNETGWLVDAENWADFYQRLYQFKLGTQQIDNSALEEQASSYYDDGMKQTLVNFLN